MGSYSPATFDKQAHLPLWMRVDLTFLSAIYAVARVSECFLSTACLQ
jgi:hypothetical protein